MGLGGALRMTSGSARTRATQTVTAYRHFLVCLATPPTLCTAPLPDAVTRLMTLGLYVDHTFYESYGTTEAVTTAIANIFASVNLIYVNQLVLM